MMLLFNKSQLSLDQEIDQNIHKHHLPLSIFQRVYSSYLEQVKSFSIPKIRVEIN